MAKMTKKDYFAILNEVVANSGREDTADLTDFINHEIEMLSRKRSSSGKKTPLQVQNEGVKERIYATLQEIGKPVTIADLRAYSEEMFQYTPQKLRALLGQMSEVVITSEKKKSYFSLVA